MTPHRDLAELELTTAQRRLLERLVALVDFVDLVGADLGTGRRLVHLGLAKSFGGLADPVHGRSYRTVKATEAAARWLELHPRRGRPRAQRGGLSERIDVRIDKATADVLDAEAKHLGVSRGEFARTILEGWTNEHGEP